MRSYRNRGEGQSWLTKKGRRNEYYACIRRPSWPRRKFFPLRTTDKWSAESKMAKLLHRLEREEAGIALPPELEGAAATPITAHLRDYLATCRANGRRLHTITKYEAEIRRLCQRCGWVLLGDITLRSYDTWRTTTARSRKSLRDGLTTMRTFLVWLRSRSRIELDSLEHAGTPSAPWVMAFHVAP